MVEVTFDPKVVTREEIVAFASADARGWSQPTVDPAALRADEDPKHELGQTPLRHVPMTEAQAVRLNARHDAAGIRAVLSPRQRELLDRVRAKPEREWPDLIGVPLQDAWSRVEEAEARTG